MKTLWSPIVGFVAAYLLGSFPTGLIVGKLFFRKDPREGGSGASGATNIFRQFGAAAGIAVTVVDVAKGALAVLASSALGVSSGVPRQLLEIGGAVFAVLGHVYPIFAGFRGGKGVATGAGALLSIAPGAALFSAIGFLLTLGITGIVSASSIAAAVILPISVALGATGSPPEPWILGFSAVLALFVIYTHRANIRRILKGQEKAFDKLSFLRRKPRR